MAITYSQLGRYGRFANALYQIAGTIGIATRSGQPWGFPRFINYDAKFRFDTKEDIDVYKHLENELPYFIQGHTYEPLFVHWGYHETVLPTGSWDLSGHLQSPKYFNHCLELVKQTLKFKDEPPLNDYVAVHYRAGDYEESPEGYHPRCSKEYFDEARKHFEGEKFFVFSDDITEARKIFNGAEYSEGRDYIEDYKLMKSCKGFIISNSSYSSFAATMNGGKTVAPRKWFGEVAGITGNDIYKKDWVVI